METFKYKLHLASPLEFTFEDDLFEGCISTTTKVIHNETHVKCAKHSFTSTFNDESKEKFIKICNDTLKIQDYLPFYNKITFIIEPNENIIPAFLTTYHDDRSLLDMLIKQNNTEIIRGWNEQTKIIFLYCLSCFLEKLHSKNQFHGRLKASNIILNDNFYPLVTDLFLYKLDDDSNFDKTIDLIVSLAPEVLFNSKRSLKSDIYSFGIISLQIFLQKINIFSDNDEISNLEKEILNFDFSEVLESIPEPIRPIIQKCLLFDSDNRPEASEIKKVIGATLMTE